MPRWSTLFVVLAILAGVFGLSNFDSTQSGGGRILFFVLLGFAVVCFGVERARRGR